jgi:anthranilate phosphoribosyltransferase
VLFDVRNGKVTQEERHPEDYGLSRCEVSSLAGGDAHHNAAALKAVLTGVDRGPHRDCLLLGAALALEVAGEERLPRDAVKRAAEAIDSGAARRTIDALVKVTA